jgi:hypothetical protein
MNDRPSPVILQTSFNRRRRGGADVALETAGETETLRRWSIFELLPRHILG